MAQYAIYRYGCNSANQHMHEKAVLGLITAKNRNKACELFLEENTQEQVYHNQFLEAVPVSRLSNKARQEAQKAEEDRKEALQAWNAECERINADIEANYNQNYF